MTGLRLSLRTPHGLLFEREVFAITAEDESGWFGIWPGRADLMARLPPGLLTFRAAEGERFVALSGGLLELRAGMCRVLCREAQISASLEEVGSALARAYARRAQRGERTRGVLEDLEREALRRLAREARA